MEPNLPAWFGPVYFGTKYMVAALFVWFSIHLWVQGRLGGKVSGYDFRPWLSRHPMAMIGLGVSLSGVMLYAMNHLRDASVYVSLLMAGEPFLYTWSALAVICLSGASAVYLYSRRSLRLGGASAMVAVMLTALVVPYYSMVLLQ